MLIKCGIECLYTKLFNTLFAYVYILHIVIFHFNSTTVVQIRIHTIPLVYCIHTNIKILAFFYRFLGGAFAAFPVFALAGLTGFDFDKPLRIGINALGPLAGGGLFSSAIRRSGIG